VQPGRHLGKSRWGEEASEVEPEEGAVEAVGARIVGLGVEDGERASVGSRAVGDHFVVGRGRKDESCIAVGEGRIEDAVGKDGGDWVGSESWGSRPAGRRTAAVEDTAAAAAAAAAYKDRSLHPSRDQMKSKGPDRKPAKVSVDWR
jgi:hypothetical protein